MEMPRISSTDVPTLKARDLIEALQNTAPDAPFTTLNDTHHAALRSLAEIFNQTPKVSKQTTDRHHGCPSQTHELPSGPNHVSVSVTHW